MKKQSAPLVKSAAVCLLFAVQLFIALPLVAEEQTADTTAADTDATATATDAEKAESQPVSTEADEAAATDGTTATVEATASSETTGTAVTTQSSPAEGEEKKGEEKITDEAAAFFDSIGIRVLKDEAYPTYLTRGLKGGSLWRTFHGLQWPYMLRSGIGISGSIWIDTGYEKINREEDPNQPDTKYILQEGRFVLRVTPTYTRNRWFIQGQAEFVANKDQSKKQPDVADADDLWVRAGKWNLFDIQAGRFEAWELYHFGMGMDINTQERIGVFESTGGTAPAPYVTYTFDRPAGLGNIAAHLYPTKFFRFELLGQLGTEGGQNTGAFRGAGILDFGFVKIKGGGEYKTSFSQTGRDDRTDDRGVAGSVQFVIKEYVEFGGSGGWSITDSMDSQGKVNQEASFTTWTAGGFANARIIKDLLIGGGAHYTSKWDIHKDANGKVGEYGHLQTFGALQYCLFDRFYIKGVVAWAKGDFAPSFSEKEPYSTYMISGRLRFQFDF